jgi:magnesium transporter
MDFLVDQYFPILEAFEGQVVELEEVILGEKFIQGTTSRIYNLRRELLSITRAVWPLGDVFVTLPHAISQPMPAVTPPILN